MVSINNSNLVYCFKYLLFWILNGGTPAQLQASSNPITLAASHYLFMKTNAFNSDVCTFGCFIIYLSIFIYIIAILVHWKILNNKHIHIHYPLSIFMCNIYIYECKQLRLISMAIQINIFPLNSLYYSSIVHLQQLLSSCSL